MKRTERRHLKQNELETWSRQARDMVEGRRRETTMALAAIAIVGAAALGYFGWRQHVQGQAYELLAQAVAVSETRVGAPIAPGTPGAGPSFLTETDRAKAALPKFKAAADAHPSTDAGVFARYQEASMQMTLGNPTEAAKAYQQVIAEAGNGLYGQTARLGLAEAQARSGQYDQAIATFKDLSQRKDGTLPVDAILMQLGRVYRDAGKASDAQQTFTRILQEFPESIFASDAKRELDTLRKT